MSDGPVIIRPAGEVDTTDAAGLETALSDALDSGAQGVVTVLDDITFLSSSGLSVLVAAAARADDSGVGFALAGGSRSTVRVLEITGLISRLGHHASLDDAVRAAGAR